MKIPNTENRRLIIALTVTLATFPQAIFSQGPAAPSGLLRVKKPIPNQYIVVFKAQQPRPNEQAADAAATAKDMSLQYGAHLGLVYTQGLRGFSAQMSETQALAISKDSRVAYVEPDSAISPSATQVQPPWGLDRIDQRQWTNGTYNYWRTGAGVHAYVIDTGIRSSNTDFAGRLSFDAPDYIGDGRNGDDCNGHGTFVAGVLGGTTFGVAKQVVFHPVRVMDCLGNGTVSSAIHAINWVTANRIRPAVVNLSLGASPSTSLDDAVRNSIANGITYAIAACNDNEDASNCSPARVAEAITVAATDITDTRAAFSNFGPLIDLFAPGVNITSDGLNGPATQSGTSFASPHVAGVVAQYLQLNPNTDPATMRNLIVNTSTKNVVVNPGPGSPNALLYTNFPVGTVNISGQEQYECIPSATRECASIRWDSGTVTVTVSGRSYSTPYGRTSTGTSIASGLAATINADPAVTATASGSVITLVSRTFSCYTITATSASSQPAMFSPSFAPTPAGPNCQ